MNDQITDGTRGQITDPMSGQPTEHGRRIVVGVDGSDASKTALRWAMAQARLIDATVEAVHAWQDPSTYGSAYSFPPQSFEGDTFAALAARSLDDTIAEVAAQLRLDPPIDVVARLVQGHTAQVLLDAATDAQMLVVGSHGHSTFAGMLLGSVSQHVVQHASCSVVVAR